MFGQEMLLKTLLASTGLTPEVVERVKADTLLFFAENRAQSDHVKVLANTTLALLESHKVLHEKLDALRAGHVCAVCDTAINSEGEYDDRTIASNQPGSEPSA